MKPRSCRHSTMTRVSSLQRAPRNVVSPGPNAARIRARLVMLFEPGTVISAWTARSSGTISIRSGKAMPSLRGAAGTAAPSVATFLGLREKLLDGLPVSRVESDLEFLEIFDKHAQHARKVHAVREANVPPHLWRTGGDTRRIAKTIGTHHRLFLRMHGTQHIIHQLRRHHMRQMTRPTHQIVVCLR